MNITNKFKRRAISHNQNSNPHELNNRLTACKQHIFNRTDFQKMQNKNQLSSRMMLSGYFQMEPFGQIQNNISQSSNRLAHHIINRKQTPSIKNKERITKTNKPKPRPKMNSSHRQAPTQKQDKAFQSNFQLLKNQINALQSQQILRGTDLSICQDNQDSKKNLQWNKLEPNYLHENQFIVNRFICGKNISLFLKQKQNIKKVMKRSTVRNYINPCKKATEPSVAWQSTNPAMNSLNIFIRSQKDKQIANVSTEHYFKRRQTPQIVRKYYRPQSCFGKRQTPISNYKSFKIQLTNCISSNSIIPEKQAGQKRSKTFSSVQNYYTQEKKKYDQNRQSVIIFI